MSIRLSLPRLVATFVAFIAAAAALADSQTQFVRIDLDEDAQPRALQVSIVTYAPTDERLLGVDLLGAIHIGDAAYYRELNDRFREYDALLYELVAPQEAVASNRLDKRKGILSTTQAGMTKLLDLTFQLDEINYDQANFVHADLSPSELRASMEERGESLYVYFWRLFFASMDEYAKDPLGLRDIEMMSSMLSSNQDDSLKTMLAYEMTNVEQVQDILGDDSGSAVIGARNQRAIDVLKEQIDAGAKRIGIFYGVAHMPDLESRLRDQLDLHYERTEWVDAWVLGNQAAAKDE